MAFNSNKFISPLFKFFGKKLAGVPPSPTNGDVAVFNGASQEWELQQIIIGSAVQSSSNVGSGDGLALPRVLDDLPFKSLVVDGTEIIITVNPQTLDFSIGVIPLTKLTPLTTNRALISDGAGVISVSTITDTELGFLSGLIENVQNALNNRFKTFQNIGGASEIGKLDTGTEFDLRTLLGNVEIIITTNMQTLAFTIGVIAQSKITGLVTALASKIETISNVGGFAELIKAKVGTNVDVRTLKEGTNITIVQNVDDIEISSTDTGEANTASNVGTGKDVFLQKVLVDLQFRTLLENTEILIVQNALDLAFSIGEIPQAKITNLVADLASKLESPILISDVTGLQAELDSKLESPILISDVTGLQLELDSKIETITNVGTGAGLIAKAKVGTNVDLRTLLAGTNITIVNNADDITISATGGGASTVAIFGNNLDEQDMVDGEFFPVLGSDRQENDEARAQVVIPQALTLRRLAIVISANARTSVTNFNLRNNGVTVNQSIAIPATTTGTFQDVVNSDVIANLDLLNYINVFGAGGGVITINSASMESIA